MKHTIKLFPQRHGKVDAKAMLIKFLHEHGDDITDVCLVAKTKDGECLTYASTEAPWFMFGGAVVMADLGLKCLNGEVETE